MKSRKQIYTSLLEGKEGENLVEGEGAL